MHFLPIIIICDNIIDIYHVFALHFFNSFYQTGNYAKILCIFYAYFSSYFFVFLFFSLFEENYEIIKIKFIE